MRTTMGWALAALMLAGFGCGGSSGSSSPVIASGTEDGQQGDDGGYDDGGECKDGEDGKVEICAVCKATGGGVFYLGDQRLTFGLNAIPDAHPGAGFGGEGISAKGHIEIQLHQTNNVFGTVDTLLACEELDGVTSATFSGELRGGGRFLATVTDAGEPGRPDTIAFTNEISFGPMELEQGGNLQVRAFDRCEPQCPEGMCWRECSQVCEPCPPPACPEGTAWNAETLRCEAPWTPPPACSEGTVWNPDTQACEPPDDPYVPL